MVLWWCAAKRIARGGEGGVIMLINGSRLMAKNGNQNDNKKNDNT